MGRVLVIRELIFLVLATDINVSMLSNVRSVVNAESESDEFIASFMIPQNEARSEVGVDLLQWDAKLEGYAHKYAERRRGDCLLQHSDGPFGENIFWGSGGLWTPQQAMGAWLDEKNWFIYSNNSCACSHDCTHYTQIVWRNTTQLGYAQIRCVSGDTFITYNYYPPSNYNLTRPY